MSYTTPPIVKQLLWRPVGTLRSVLRIIRIMRKIPGKARDSLTPLYIIKYYVNLPPGSSVVVLPGARFPRTPVFSHPPAGARFPRTPHPTPKHHTTPPPQPHHPTLGRAPPPVYPAVDARPRIQFLHRKLIFNVKN